MLKLLKIKKMKVQEKNKLNLEVGVKRRLRLKMLALIFLEEVMMMKQLRLRE